MAQFFNNPGNIKAGSSWKGETYGDGVYRKYPTKAEGLAAIIDVMKGYDTNSLNEILNRYSTPDESGEPYEDYYKDLTEIYEVPENINFSDDMQVIRLMKGVTDVENPPEANDYYLDNDYIDALQLIRQDELLTGRLGVT